MKVTPKVFNELAKIRRERRANGLCPIHGAKLVESRDLVTWKTVLACPCEGCRYFKELPR